MQNKFEYMFLCNKWYRLYRTNYKQIILCIDTYTRICRIAPYLPKISYISSEVILYGKLRMYSTRFTSGGNRICKTEERSISTRDDTRDKGHTTFRTKDDAAGAASSRRLAIQYRSVYVRLSVLCYALTLLRFCRARAMLDECGCLV